MGFKKLPYECEAKVALEDPGDEAATLKTGGGRKDIWLLTGDGCFVEAMLLQVIRMSE